MIGIHPDCPPGVVLLADHLDAALAVGEDLLASALPARADLDEADAETAPDALDGFVRRLRHLEASLLLRLLQARRLAGEIGRADLALRAAGALFRAQTGALHDVIADAGRGADASLSRAGDSHAYLRSRGLIAPEAAAPSPYAGLAIDEAFPVGGAARLGQVLDLVSALLDLLDARFGLYAREIEDEAVQAEACELVGSTLGDLAEEAAGGDLIPPGPPLATAVAEAKAVKEPLETESPDRSDAEPSEDQTVAPPAAIEDSLASRLRQRELDTLANDADGVTV